MRIESDQDESKFTLKKLWRFFSKDESRYLENDRELEFEADNSGMIHVRKNRGETKFLRGYGTSDFGVSSFEDEESHLFGKLLLGSAILVTGAYLATNYRTLTDYALLLKESSKDWE